MRVYDYVEMNNSNILCMEKRCSFVGNVNHVTV